LAVPAAFIALGINPAGTPVASAIYNATLLLIFVIFSLACLRHGDEAEAVFLRKDPSEVVADETAAQCLPLLFLPTQAFANPRVALFTTCFAFIAFRVLDIVKPWPAHRMQRFAGGTGILVDDIFAGLYAAAIMQILTRAML
jgi:phosphatidylglycerophosphatase A